MHVLADVLEGHVATAPLGPHGHADPHIVQHRLLRRSTLQGGGGGMPTQSKIVSGAKRRPYLRNEVGGREEEQFNPKETSRAQSERALCAASIVVLSRVSRSFCSVRWKGRETLKNSQPAVMLDC